MSDLYLVLRHRLEDVIDWVELGTDVMRDARKRTGLSYESMSRQINVSAKTYERYEKAGRVPRQLLPKIAEELNLEIESPARQRVTVNPPADRETAARDLAELQASVDRIEQLLNTLLDPPRDAPGSA